MGVAHEPAPFNVRKAVKAWRENIPERGERIAFLRSELYDCRGPRTVRKRSNTVTVEYPITAGLLEAMLEAEGA
jgi:hypothetical protein